MMRNDYTKNFQITLPYFRMNQVTVRFRVQRMLEKDKENLA